MTHKKNGLSNGLGIKVKTVMKVMSVYQGRDKLLLTHTTDQNKNEL